jgi:nucleoid-associated protein EbfC
MAGLGDLGNIMGQVKQMQANMKQMQEDLRKKTVQASSGGGMVTATVNGHSELVGLKIDPQAVDVNDLEMLEDLVKAAVNAAVAKSQEEMKQEMARLTGGFNIPGLENIAKMFG